MRRHDDASAASHPATSALTLPPSPFTISSSSLRAPSRCRSIPPAPRLGRWLGGRTDGRTGRCPLIAPFVTSTGSSSATMILFPRFGSEVSREARGRTRRSTILIDDFSSPFSLLLPSSPSLPTLLARNARTSEISFHLFPNRFVPYPHSNFEVRSRACPLSRGHVLLCESTVTSIIGNRPTRLWIRGLHACNRASPPNFQLATNVRYETIDAIHVHMSRFLSLFLEK